MENAVKPGVGASQTSGAGTELISSDEQERFLSILNFWHKIEFFIPFDLDGRIAETGEDRIRYLPRQDLSLGSSTLWQVEVQEDEEVKRFHVYLCLFDKSEIARVCDSTSRAGDDEEFERTELEGRSCFARLTVDPRGELLLESKGSSSPVSYVSTLPWALGQYQKAGLASLTFDSFENAKQNLAELLLNFKVGRKAPTRQESGEYNNPLTHSDIVELHETFQNWAGFSSGQADVIGVVEIVTGKKPKQDRAAEKADDTDEPDSAEEESEPDIAILNSFFIQDIENAIKEVKAGHISRPLKNFLSPFPVAERVDLESPSGLLAILDTLHPSRTNLGRWLSNADLPMTLMQQFAVNMVVQGQAAPPLFSVNGPPGTGKTTFLRDIFADLIVSRARALAKLAKPRDAFLRKNLQVSFKRGQSRDISVLRPELTGFEIVVASSNNAAVENISGDLPKAGKLGSHWSTAEYLKPVAYKVAAQEDADSFKKLSDSDQPWGLISCALGNSNNRHRFKERFCYMEVPKDQTLSLQLPDRPQNIREWIDNYRGPTFRSAVDRFRKKDLEVFETSARLNSLANLLSNRLSSIHEDKLSSIRLRMEECQAERLNCQREKQDLAVAIERLRSSLDDLKEDERLLNRSAPGWLAKMRRSSAAKLHDVQVRENACAQLRARKQLSEWGLKRAPELHARLTVLSDRLDRLEAESKQAEAEKEMEDREFEIAGSEFAFLKLPKNLDDLRAGNFQISGLWHHDILAQRRSELFAAALSLHEAWLAFVGKRKAGFRQNILAIADLLSGRRLENQSHALTIWQTLFLIVPIVSTTFASFQNQFADLGSASLGWLFIDEAGQAVPQAAVGALWRAKHAIVVGDPLQIEPVFTLPSRFITAVAKLSSHTADGGYSPHRTSVQTLADNANKFGVTIRDKDGKGVWVGSPLRVHFRCIEPMFGWSNDIAYNGKMVSGTRPPSESEDAPIACESAWIDIKGNVSKRQAVPEQTRFVIELLLALYKRDQQLPRLYLISPFKAIKAELTREILDLNWVRDAKEIKGPKKHELKKWCKERIGTVHTFQGKEEHSVLMILGADAQHAFSADWACAKPNILNVALTRAQRRFYLIGDRELWGARGPFAWSIDRLPTMSARQFLASAQNRSALGKSTSS